MGVIANDQGIVIVNRSFYWTSYTDCSVPFVGHTPLSRVHNIYGYG